jgi:hypothetical protein
MTVDPGRSRTPQELLANRWWRIRHSWWILLPVLGLGFLTWAAFLYLGARVGRRAWYVVSAIYLVLVVVLLVAFPETTGEETGTRADLVGGLIVALWAAGSLHALLVRRRWLQLRAQLVPWYATASGTVAPGSPAEQGPGPRPFAAPGDLPGPVSAPVASVPPSAVRAAPTGSQVVDINTASAEVLAGLPGLTPSRVQEILRGRERLGGFNDLDALVTALHLAPHEMIGLRDRVVFSPVVPPTSGPRILDV